MARARRKVTRIEEPERSDRERKAGRFRVYVFEPRQRHLRGIKVPGGDLVHLASTPNGLEACLIKLREEGQISHKSIVGIKDDVERHWLVNPMAHVKGGGDDK